MKINRIIKILNTVIAALFLFVEVSGATNQLTLTGQITDAVTHQPVPGATIYIPDLKRGSISDSNGFYSIPNLPQSRLTIQVSCVGYKMQIEQVDLSVSTIKNFQLTETIAELNEVVVTGLAGATEKNKASTPVVTISAKHIAESSGTNIVDVLSHIPGISQVSTGPAISKPVVRGLGFNRVVVVNEGIRQEGQQWGDEHGLEMDEYSVNNVEILKGPASLMYGSDAMAGVINFLPGTTEPPGKIKGKLLTNYQTNNGLIGTSFSLSGNRSDILWDLHLSNKMAHAYKNNEDGFVYNSGFNEQSVSGLAGINKSWGYSHLHFSVYRLNAGIVEGERDSVTGNFIKPVALNDSTVVSVITTGDDHTSYSTDIPFQEIGHYKMVLNNSFIIKNSTLKVIGGWQQNQRKEFGDVLHQEDVGLNFLLNTVNYDVRYMFPQWKKFNASAGINGMYQDSRNKGIEFLVPEYNLFDFGIYGIIRKSLNKLDVSAGLRYDIRNQHSFDLYLDEDGMQTEELLPGGIQRFKKFDRTFYGVSGSLGFTYQLSEILYTKLNFSRGFRAPNIAELGSNGEHEGTGRYEIGDPLLKPENSMQWDFTLGINSAHITGEINLFSNSIDNFISISKLVSAVGGDSLIDELPVFYFTSDKARLTGGEIFIDIHPHPLDWLHIENSFSYVEGIRLGETGGSKYLPFIPAPRFTSELKADQEKQFRNFKNSFMSAGLEYHFRQSNIFTVNNTETPTPAYYLINVGMGTELHTKNKKLFTFYLSVNNIFDKSYQDHLSRLKYAPVNYKTGKRGVFEMGRNISVKVVIPFNFT